MSQSFLDGLSVNTTKNLKMVQGAAYLPWVVAFALANRPAMQIALTGNGQVIHEVFGGGAVAIDMALGERVQRTWLPILNPRNQPIPFQEITSREANDTIQRARTKAIAMVTGVGMSIYANHNGVAEKFVVDLGIKEDSNLEVVKALSTEKKDQQSGRVLAKYLDWAVALSAARITDPDFHWEVGLHTNHETGEVGVPYIKTNNTYMVSVNLVYKGECHTEFLPVMGILPVQTKNGVKKMDYQPLTEPTVSDWNRAVMRCLAKGISVITGYGLSLYAGEDVTSLAEHEEDPLAHIGNQPPVAAKQEPQTATEKKEQRSDDRDALEQTVRERLTKAGRTEEGVCNWLSIKSLGEASNEELARVLDVLDKFKPAA